MVDEQKKSILKNMKPYGSIFKHQTYGPTVNISLLQRAIFLIFASIV